MTPSPYSEDTLVQQTMAAYLEQELGWDSVFAFNEEDFGPESLLGRLSDKEVVLERDLREALKRLNPGYPSEAYEDALRQLCAVNRSQSMVAQNRDLYGLIRDGVTVSFRNEKGERVRERLEVIDFADASRNRFLCVRELWVRGDLYRRRADLVGFVNGLPLLFVECKNIHRNLRAAFEENFSDYKDTVPHLFHHNAVVMFGNGEKAKVGSLTSEWAHFHEWKRLNEQDPGKVDMEILLRGICDKRNFLDLVENFILFDNSSGKTVKILARNHQFMGVNRALSAVENRKSRDGKLGVFWHTQGSGKSYSMLFFTRKVHRKLGGNFTFLILTDRDDLDTQIYKTYAGCNVVDHDRDPCRAGDGAHLKALLQQHKSYVFSLIQKFNQDVSESDAYSDRDDVIVVSDEAHRTQYGTLALNMRNALPNASYIGFTGTPLFKEDEITRQVFGDYVSTYNFVRAQQDQATVPLYYDARGEALGIVEKDLNARIQEKLNEFDLGTLDEAERLERDLKRDYHILTAGKRLTQVAEDFVEHYSRGWESGKAMLVCLDKITCVRMHKLIEHFWEQRIHELDQEVLACQDEQQKGFLMRQLQWMRDTRICVVVSEEQGEVAKFEKWNLDIKPHRRLMKEGIELPEHMRHRPEFQNKQRLEMDEAFKSSEHPFRVAIVCAMWLTGFDVPSMGTLYLDKPLKAHTLMQAIARANRVREGKENGLIVDYCGILKHLRQALATFGGDDGSGGGEGPARPKEELLARLEEALKLAKDFLDLRGAPLSAVQGKNGFERIHAISQCKEAVNTNDESRKRFELLCRQVFRCFKACINIRPEVNSYRADRDALNIVYKSLQQDKEAADISHILQALHAVVDKGIVTTGQAKETTPYDISKIDFDLLAKEFEKSSRKNSTVQNLKTVIEKRLKRMLLQNPLRTDFQQHYEALIAAYNREKDQVTIEQTFEELMNLYREMDEESKRAKREMMEEEELAVFDLLKKEALSKEDLKRIKFVAASLLETLKKGPLAVDHWDEKEATRDAVITEIRDFLWSDQTGLPESSYSEEDIQQATAQLYMHIRRAYPRLPSPIYGEETAA